MDHLDAVGSQSAEKYLLGELRAAERDDFEDHFFACAECAEAVRTGMLFLDNGAAEARHAVRSPAAKPVAGGWKDWFRWEWRSPAFALPLLALVAVSGLWIADRGRLRRELADATAPQALINVPLDVTRGGAPATVSRKDRFFAVSFFLEPLQNSSYTIQISGNGAEPASIVMPDRADGRYNLLLPAGRYPPGVYELLVKAGSAPGGAVVQRFPLTLK